MVVHSIELCAGVGMLGEGLRAGLGYLGFENRAVCYVEREAHAAAVLAARMEEGSLDAAPVWSDMVTFDGRRFRGCVDVVAAGFPCQDLSVAGSRAGLNGSRSGLFFRVLDIADDCDARWLFLENVAGIVSATAAVVDEASASDYAAKPHGGGFSHVGVEDGRLLERAAARVVGELADRGWHAEWLHLSASDVGASHGRERWLCFAWRVADADGIPHERRGEPGELAGSSGPHQGEGHQRQRRRNAADDCIEAVDNSARHGGGGQERQGGGGRELRAAGHALDTIGVADADEFGRRGEQQPRGARQCGGEPAGAGQAVAHADGPGCGAIGQREREHADAAPIGDPMADAGQPRLPLAEPGELRGPGRWGEGRAVEQLRCPPFLFAPGPEDERWSGIVREFPHLAPALEPDFRQLVNGLDFDMDDSRAARLKCVGNGVVALCAALAFVVLAWRAGLMPR